MPEAGGVRQGGRPFGPASRIGSAGLFRPCGVGGLADATGIGTLRFLAGTKHPQPILSRPWS
jgi:hypothetical protein